MVICDGKRYNEGFSFNVKNIAFFIWVQPYCYGLKFLATHNDYGAGDGDCSHGPMGDGVSPVWIADALVIAVNSSLIRAEHQCQDGRRQSRWRKKKKNHCIAKERMVLKYYNGLFRPPLLTYDKNKYIMNYCRKHRAPQKLTRYICSFNKNINTWI